MSVTKLLSISRIRLPLVQVGALAQVGSVLTFLSLPACSGDGEVTDEQADADGSGGEQGSTGGVGSGAGGDSAAAGGDQAVGGAEAAGGAPNTGGSSQGAGGSAIVSCGDATCGPGEYCRAGCNGTGGPVGPPTCAPLPEGCEEDPSCECVCSGFTSFCTPGAEAIQCGCP